MQSEDYLELKQHIQNTLRQGGGSRASVYHILWQNEHYVLKDYHACSLFFRVFISPIMIYREAQKLKQLKDVAGVPDWVASWSKVLVLEYKPALRPSKVEFDEDSWNIFEKRLYALIENMHQAGVAHADLRSPGNVIVTEDFKPIIIDFVASISKPKLDFPPFNTLFNKICQIDITSVLKIKHRVVPSLLTEQEKLSFQKAKSRGKLLRYILDNGRKFFQK